ncbi:hypothetical protein [Bacillus sp. FJAT-45066]|uniref:hypothetical protein n=1 Tax=Bacillus sp. FJAT-45066 TaxID=2011010 RepID=UPI000BB83364|nr:hypothetical protein [Bacillus sp. FJAT-45066]
MIIKKAIGYELEKAQSNTSEDFFNRSEVTFLDEEVEKTFHVLYVRYFEETFADYVETEAKTNPLFTVNGKQINFRDVVALTCLIKNTSYKNRKRLYINVKEDMEKYFHNVNINKLKDIYEALESKGEYNLTSPLSFLKDSEVVR